VSPSDAFLIIENSALFCNWVNAPAGWQKKTHNYANPKIFQSKIYFHGKIPKFEWLSKTTIVQWS